MSALEVIEAGPPAMHTPEGARKTLCAECGEWWFQRQGNLRECGRCRRTKKQQILAVQAAVKQAEKDKDALTDDELRDVCTEEERWNYFHWLDKKWV